MRTSMTYPIRFWATVLAFLLIFQFRSEVLADSCEYKTDIELTLDVSNSDVLAIAAVAGDLEIVGIPAKDTAHISGKLCSSKESWLEESRIATVQGERAEINVVLPTTEGGWQILRSNYLTLDLRIEVPEDLMLEIKDSSGDTSLDGVSIASLQDSSGDIEIDNTRGIASIRDSSGDIDIDGHSGNLTIEADSSGDIYVENIKGEVLIEQDSSGDIQVSHVSESVVVLRDSSGDIRASDVGGDFRVVKDGSGDIRSSDIKGQVDVPSKS
jgi:DUF4097 and DUF4098 domain-containing protein YvlB